MKKDVNVNTRAQSVSNFRQPSPLDSFYCKEVQTKYGGIAVKFQTDVTLLFNQKRLDKMTAATLENYITDMLRNDSDPLSQLRGKLTPQEICSFVKSRYIQTKSELQGYCDYLNRNYEDVSSELKEYAAAIQAQQQQSSTEPPKTE